jgi:hypothetical protein
MNPHLPKRRLTRSAAVALAAAGVAVSATGAGASVGQPATLAINPYSPAYHHAYRHGVTPTRSQYQKMRQWTHSHPQSASASALSASDLNYGGGIDGIGVTTGHEKVYLIFYGSQWGSQSTDSNGDVTLSGDPSGEAPYLQQFIKGLGTGNELWSGVMTQYCDGVTAGAQSCPADSTEHVAYPTGGALAGVWVDESAASPNEADGNQLGAEAVNAAAHFGNTTAAANRDAQYVILSPTGTDPDGWLDSGFCAWHDDTSDSALSGGPATSPYGDIAFTNLPYLTDEGELCGQDFVNSTGTLDGLSIVEGHEYAETITDQNPPGGWTDSSGAETGDKCAWITPGTAGGAFDLTTGTGTFAVQTTWANDGSGGSGACEGSHPIVTNPAPQRVTVTSPGTQVTVIDTSVSLQIHATDAASGQTLTYSATGLPTGLSVNSTTGLITGTPTTTAMYSVTVTAKDTTGASGTASFRWTITGSGCTAAQLIGNPGFETGSLAPWTATLVTATYTVPSSDVLYNSTVNDPYPTHSGNWDAFLGIDTPYTDTLAQTVTIPSACKTATLSLWLDIESDQPSPAAVDTLTVQVLGSSGTVLATLATFSNLDGNDVYIQHSYNMASFIGQKITLQFTATQGAAYGATYFLDDDNALNVS